LYILQSEKSGRYYTGSTSDLEDRVRRHNAGYSKATKGGVPWKLVYTEEFQNRSDAYRRELEIKGWKSRKLIDDLITTKREEHSD
jgi:putative endonuclease